MRQIFHATCFFCLLFCFSCKNKHYTDPLSPEEALASFQLNEDFNIEIFAAEPFVNDPVAMAFDDGGNAFVVEMYDYPFPPEPGKEKGQIRVLLDTDKDGRIDKSVVFADSLSEATSILPWKGGLLVAAAPNILYLKDTNGDFRADIKEILFSGFFKGNSEAQVTGLYFNIDNWIYASNSGQNGTATGEGPFAGKELPLGGADFRFRMDRGQFELESGSGQFGQTMDDWGRRFLTQNSLHIEQAVIPWRYLHRHSYLPPISVVRSISDHQELMKQVTPPPYWRAERSLRRNQTFKEQNLDRIEYADGHFTGAAGGIIYGGDAFPEKYYGNYFVTDVAGNLVHRDVLVPLDSTPLYAAKLDVEEKDKEFLTSTDPWFRPVNFTVDPDGSLYVIDMYRQHIEAPFAIPEDLKKEMDFMNGSELGRIYRIVAKDAKLKKEAAPNFREMNTQDVLDYISHSNKQLRLQAQRVLLERQDKSIAPRVKDIFMQTKDPRVRLHSLYVLEGLNALDVSLVKQALKDEHPGLRENVMRLAEQFPECLPDLAQGIEDASIQVAFQACLSLGNYPFAKSAPSLAACILKYGQNRWFRIAVLSSEAGSSYEFFEMLVNRSWFSQDAREGQVSYLEEFSRMLALRNSTEQTIRFLNATPRLSIKKEMKYTVAALSGLTRGFKESENKSNQSPALNKLLEDMFNAASDNQEKDAIQKLMDALK